MGVFSKVPVVGQGTWEIEEDPKQSIRALQRGIELGMTHIDTAEMYGDGRAEELVGRAIAGRREEVFIVSKVLPQHAAYEKTLAACERTLKRLKTDHLDVYLLHWREDTPLEETFRAFEKLVEQGKIRAWGVSNFDVGDLEEAEKIAGRGKIACNQVLYNLWQRTVEHEVEPWCKEHGVPIVAYSPFAQRGVLEHDGEKKALMRRIAGAHDVSEHALALRFVVQHGAWTIPKSSNVEHVEENAKALHVALSADELAELDRAFPRGKRGALPML